MASSTAPQPAATLPTELAFLSLFPPSDSESEEESEAPPRLSSKEERIQRAIDQGKASYGWAQAETKFGWFADSEVTSKKTAEGKVEARNKEYIAQSCYHRQMYAESLAISLEILEPEGVDNREILDLALRCCLKVGDKQNGERLARGCRSKWITTMYLAHTCGMVLTLAGLYSDSLKALLCALSPRAIQYPHLRSLSDCLTAWAASPTLSEPERDAIKRLLQDVRPATEALAHHYSRPLFSDEKLTRRENALKLAGEESKLAEHVWLTPVEVDAIGKTLKLDARAEGRIQNVWLKLAALARATGGEQELEEEEDRGVRGL